MNTRIFVSYAREDIVPAEALVAFLESAGFNTWFDKKNLLVGQDWRKVIKKEIASARLLILCLSRNSVEKTGFVQEEMRLALEQARLKPPSKEYIMPIMLNDCEVPDEIARWHGLDLRQGNAPQKLLEAIQNATGDGARAPNTAHEALVHAISQYNSSFSREDSKEPHLSEIARELLQLILNEHNPGERGIVEILREIIPGLTMFFPRIEYSGSPMEMKTRLFRQATHELVAVKLLYPPENNPSSNTRTFEYRGHE